jgi:hypothetical protein
MWLKTKFFGDLYSRIWQEKPAICQIDLAPHQYQQKNFDISLDRFTLEFTGLAQNIEIRLISALT